jgi:hypothetical protein
MKTIFITVVFMLAAVISNAHAGSGKALINGWRISPTEGTWSSVYVSNISSHNLNVTVKFYNQSGNIISPALITNIPNGILAAGQSGSFNISPDTCDCYGYGVIVWSNIGTDNDSVGLVSFAEQSAHNGQRSMMPINRGEAF